MFITLNYIIVVKLLIKLAKSKLKLSKFWVFVRLIIPLAFLNYDHCLTENIHQGFPKRAKWVLGPFQKLGRPWIVMELWGHNFRLKLEIIKLMSESKKKSSVFNGSFETCNRYYDKI